MSESRNPVTNRLDAEMGDSVKYSSLSPLELYEFHMQNEANLAPEIKRWEMILELRDRILSRPRSSRRTYRRIKEKA